MFRDRENQFGPGKLWSLWDMLQLYLEPLRAAVFQISQLTNATHHALMMDQSLKFGDEYITSIRVILSNLDAELEKLGANMTRISIKRFHDQLGDIQNVSAFRHLVLEIESRLRDELSIPYCLVLTPGERQLFEQVRTPVQKSTTEAAG